MSAPGDAGSRERLISVVIPAYNAERYLEQTIESVLATDVVDRIIVVDDGSTDQTAGILRRLAAEVPALVAVSQPNRGVSAARNAGLAAVTTPFTCFLDADDRFLPGGLAGLQARLLADPEAAAAYGGVDYIDEHGRAIPRRGARPRAKAIGLEDVLQGNFIDTTGAVLLRTDAAVKAGGFNESLRFAEDWELYTRIVLIGPIVPSDATVVEYRQHEQSAMHDADLDFSASHGALAVVYSPTGPGAARIDPATLQSFERRHRAGILRRLCQRRQSPAVHLRLVTALFELWAHSRGDRIIFGLFARAVLTSGRRILSHA